MSAVKALVYGPRHPARLKAQEAHDAARDAALVRASAVTGLASDALTGLDRVPEGQRAALLSELVRETAERAGLARQFATLSAQVQAETQRLDQLSPMAARLEDRQRDFAVAEATKTDVYASYSLIQVLENPSLPETPTSPKDKMAIAAGMAATIMLLVGLVLAWMRKPILSQLLNTPANATA